MNVDIQKATEIIIGGGIVIFPTDTAFGIGCRMDSKDSVDRLFRIRKRPSAQAMPMLVDSETMAITYFHHPSEIVRRLMKTYWPGALTIVSECKKDLIYSPIRAEGNTVGLRMPNHAVPMTLIQSVGVPILGSSANFHGLPTPYHQHDVDPALIDLADGTVSGDCPLGIASTVVECSGESMRIIRQGAITIS